MPSPLTQPTAIAGPTEDGFLWIVGADGVARRANHTWRRVQAPADSFQGIVLGPQGALWLLGSGHLWRATVKGETPLP